MGGVPNVLGLRFYIKGALRDEQYVTAKGSHQTCVLILISMLNNNEKFRSFNRKENIHK